MKSKYLYHHQGAADKGVRKTWEKQVLSAGGFKRVGRRLEYTINTVWRCVRRGPGGSRRGPGGSSEPPEPCICFSLGGARLLDFHHNFAHAEILPTLRDRRQLLVEHDLDRSLQELVVRIA